MATSSTNTSPVITTVQPLYSAAVCSKPDLSPNELAIRFVKRYFTAMATKPETLHQFYGQDAKMDHSSEGDVSPSQNLTIGKDKLAGFVESRITVTCMSCLPSHEGSTVVMTLGKLAKKGERPFRFAQTLILGACRISGAFQILNDILKWCGETTMVLKPTAQAAKVIMEKNSALPPLPPKTAGAIMKLKDVEAESSTILAAKPVANAEPRLDSQGSASTLFEAPASTPTPTPKTAASAAAVEAHASVASLGSTPVPATQSAASPIVEAPPPAVVLPTITAEAVEVPVITRSWATVAASAAQKPVPRKATTPKKIVAASGSTNLNASGTTTIKHDSMIAQQDMLKRSIFIRSRNMLTYADVQKTFERVGKIREIVIPSNKFICFVEFEEEVSAKRALGKRFRVGTSAVVAEVRRPKEGGASRYLGRK
ncbi:hypothetical protein HDU97_008219 [Phlyctochytrium planicorne]|nr:hypothetical protein HDU97_008219 [Phlyctochytrium planicorne]